MGLETTDAIAALDRALSPAGLDRQLDGADADECKRRFELLRGTAATVLVGMLVCVGRALEAAERGEKAADSLARLFEVSRSFVFRAGKAFREIVRPRLDVAGDAAVFPLDEIAFYFIAVDSARRLGRPALELLEHAETGRDVSRAYSVRDFREWIDDEAAGGGDEGSTTSEGGKFDRRLGQLAESGDDIVDDWVTWAASRPDARKKLERVQDAYSAVDRATVGLRERLKGAG